MNYKYERGKNSYVILNSFAQITFQVCILLALIPLNISYIIKKEIEINVGEVARGKKSILPMVIPKLL